MDRSRPRVEAIASLRMRRPGGLKWTEYLSGYAFILPALTGITLFGLLPLAYAFYVSFRRYDLLAPTSAFIGFANYQRVIADPTFWRALLNTAYYAGLLIPLGGLNAIPADYYEAAEVDGGTPFQSFKLITLPLLRRVLLFIVVINTINAFKLFTPIYVITRGGPMESTLTIVFHIFRTGFRYYDMGAASTMSVLLLLLVLGLTLAQFGLLRSERDM